MIIQQNVNKYLTTCLVQLCGEYVAYLPEPDVYREGCAGPNAAGLWEGRYLHGNEAAASARVCQHAG